MKTKFLLLMLTVSLFAFGSCNDDDNNYQPDSKYITALRTKYPEATNAVWELKHTYTVAEFYLNGIETEVWFDGNGKWVMTESDIRYEQLPAVVQEAFSQSSYASWKKEDIDKIERVDAATVYIIEVENGNQEYDLYYSEDGTLVKAIADTDGNDIYLPLPNAVKELIAQKYPQAVIIETETKPYGLEIDIIDGRIHKEVVFNTQNEWVSTSWEILATEVNAVAMNAFRASSYSSYAIDDIDYYTTPAGDYYLFELEAEPDIYLNIDLEGNITQK